MYRAAEGQGGLFVEAEGRPLSALMHERALGGRGVSVRPASELPTSNPLPDASAGRSALAVGRWVSRMYEESDPFKGFLWAYAGLEVAINKTLSQVDRNRVTDALSRAGGDAPISGGPCIRELIWPSAFKESQGTDPARDPQRNLSFGFAMLSLLTDPKRADEDVATFKSLQAFRNRIHGERIDEEEAERTQRGGNLFAPPVRLSLSQSGIEGYARCQRHPVDLAQPDHAGGGRQPPSWSGLGIARLAARRRCDSPSGGRRDGAWQPPTRLVPALLRWPATRRPARPARTTLRFCAAPTGGRA